MNYESFKRMFSRSQIVRMPQSNIETFDKSYFGYQYLSIVDRKTTRVRKDRLVVYRPFILLPKGGESPIQDFGDTKVGHFARRMFEKSFKTAKGLGYQFKHIHGESRLEPIPINLLIEQLLKKDHEDKESVIVSGEEDLWEASILKVVFKLIERSFSTNFDQLEERGLFDPKGFPPSIYEHIEDLFEKAKKSKKSIKTLGSFLLEKGLFEDYEDRFYNLIKRL